MVDHAEFIDHRTMPMPPSNRAGYRRTMIALATMAFITSGIDHAPPPDNPAVAPVPKEGEWFAIHESYVTTASRGGIDLLFLGDSITAGWMPAALDLWERHYAPRKAANFGIGADHTQHVLWRLDHGELEGIRPKVVVLMIGTNNIQDQTEDQVVEGVKAIVERLRRKLPASKILLLGIAPRGLDRHGSQATTAADPRVAPINLKLARLHDGATITYLDFGPALLNEDGRLIHDIEPDFLHFSHEGYRIWAEAMEPTLDRLMRGAEPGIRADPSK